MGRWLNKGGFVLLIIALGGGVASCNSGGGGPRRIECGGASSFPCPPGMFCDLGKRCGGVDRVGHCSYQPTEECGAEEDPVCGCDGVEYSNECLANSGGVSVDYEGPCMKDVPKPRIELPK